MLRVRSSHKTESRADLLQLLLCGICSLLIYGLGQRWFPLKILGLRQLHTLGAETHGAPSYGISMALASAALCAFYGLGYLAVRRLARSTTGDLSMAYWLVIVIPFGCAALLVWTYPITSLDIYSYIFRGLMLGHFGANTFVKTPEGFKEHPLFWYSIWREAPTAYGPLWEMIGGFTAMVVDRIGPQPLPPTPGVNDIQRYANQLIALLVAFKLLGVVAIGLCAAAIARMARFPDPSGPASDGDERLLALYVWLWNPLILWELVGAGHNDSWMLVGVLLAYAFLAQKAPRRALLALLFGVLFKAPALLFGPAILAGAVRTVVPRGEERSLRRWQQAVLMLVQGGLLCATMAVVCYAPFWAGSDTFTNPLTRERLFSGSPVTLLNLWLHQRQQWNPEDAWAMASRVSTIILAVGALWGAWRMWRRPEQPVTASIPLMIAPLLAASVFQPWYVTWALALASIQPQKARTIAVLTILALSSWWLYLANDFLLPYLGWEFGSLRWQTLLVASVYGPPVLMMLLLFGLRRIPRRIGGTAKAYDTV